MDNNFEKWLQNYDELKRIARENNLRIERAIKKDKEIYYIIEKGFEERFENYDEFERVLLDYDLML